jgi:hypothetical protein
MNRKIFLIVPAWSFGAAAGLGLTAGQDTYDLSKVASGQGWTVVNRGAAVLEDGGLSAL